MTPESPYKYCNIAPSLNRKVKPSGLGMGRFNLPNLGMLVIAWALDTMAGMDRFFGVRKHWIEIGFAALGAVVVLWQLLLPGYVLTLDMVFGPSHVFYMPQGFLDTLPLSYLIYGLSLVVPAWVVEKVMLVALFFLLFYLPLRFFPRELKSPQGEWVKYFAAVMYAVNPFVYERFLAGQWAVLFAYAFLAPLLYVLLAFLSAPRRSNALLLVAGLLLIGVFSLHALVMSILFVGLAIVIEGMRLLWRREKGRVIALAKGAALVAVVFLVVSSYWLVPLFVSHTSAISGFGSADNAAFMTAPDEYLGTIGNVALLFGFWGEAYPWSLKFISPKDVVKFVPAALALLALIAIGAVASLRTRTSRRVAMLIALFAALALVFSVGVADGPFRGINDWLFSHVYLWRGFRDSEKWSMWLALAYAYLGAVGAGLLVEKLTPRLRIYAMTVLLFVPIMYCVPLVGGFAGQIKPVWYPRSWYQVNDVLKTVPDCRAISLPWHLYHSLSFDNDILAADPSAAFFDCTIVSSQLADIGAIDVRATSTAADSSDAIQAAVTDNDASHDAASVDALVTYGIRYVIFTSDLVGVDPYTYSFLNDPRIKMIRDIGAGTSEIRLYQVGTN